MNFAVKYPDKLDKLIVVDIAPKQYPVHHDHILDGLHEIDLNTLTSRNEADQLLSRQMTGVARTSVFIKEPGPQQ